MSKEISRAKLLNSIPSSRYEILLKNTEAPKQGDIVTLDQAFTNSQGQAMVLVYCMGENETYRYEAQVYESELGPNL